MKYNFEITEFNSRLPEWVRENITTKCPYCDSYLLDNSPTGVITSRWCSNKYCPGHMQYKVEALAKHFNIAGFGVKSALRWVYNNRGKCHMEILKEWFEEPPMVRLSTVATLAFLRGYGSSNAVKDLDSFTDFDDYFSNARMPNAILVENAQYLKECSSYFTIEQPMSSKQLTVMGTGSFNGFSNRDEYFSLINKAFGSYIHVIETKGPRKTGVAYLIKEDNAPDRSKSRIAKEYGIPVVTPAQFYEILLSTCHT